MTKFSTALHGNRLAVNLPGAMITLVIHDKAKTVIVESPIDVDFSDTRLLRTRGIHWRSSPKSLKVSKTGPAIASGNGAKAVSGIDLSGSNSQVGTPDNVNVTIHVPSDMSKITVNGANHFVAESAALQKIIRDSRH